MRKTDTTGNPRRNGFGEGFGKSVIDFGATDTVCAMSFDGLAARLAETR